MRFSLSSFLLIPTLNTMLYLIVTQKIRVEGGKKVTEKLNMIDKKERDWRTEKSVEFGAI